MGIDINKIIAEATQEESANDKNIEVLDEFGGTVLEESVSTETPDLSNQINESYSTGMDTNHCVASAISAGLGAMTFRNHLRSLTEISDKTKGRLKTAAKVVGGVGAAVGAGFLAHKEGRNVVKAVKTGASKVAEHFRNKEDDTVKPPNTNTETSAPTRSAQKVEAKPVSWKPKGPGERGEAKPDISNISSLGGDKSQAGIMKRAEMVKSGKEKIGNLFRGNSPTNKIPERNDAGVSASRKLNSSITKRDAEDKFYKNLANRNTLQV